MKVKAQYKICRRLGEAVFSKCQSPKFALSESKKQTGRGRGRRPGARSEYGQQLIEKQKIRYTYGLSEKQLSNYVKEARKNTDSTPQANLFELIESRLDNIIFRMGLVSTRPFARQVASHGHIMVNGRRTTVPSYRLKKGDVVTIRPGSMDSKMFAELSERLEGHTSPAWLSFDVKKKEGKVVERPSLEEGEVGLNLGSVIEFYSRV